MKYKIIKKTKKIYGGSGSGSINLKTKINNTRQDNGSFKKKKLKVYNNSQDNGTGQDKGTGQDNGSFQKKKLKVNNESQKNEVIKKSVKTKIMDLSRRVRQKRAKKILGEKVVNSIYKNAFSKFENKASAGALNAKHSAVTGAFNAGPSAVNGAFNAKHSAVTGALNAEPSAVTGALNAEPSAVAKPSRWTKVKNIVNSAVRTRNTMTGFVEEHLKHDALVKNFVVEPESEEFSANVQIRDVAGNIVDFSLSAAINKAMHLLSSEGIISSEVTNITGRDSSVLIRELVRYIRTRPNQSERDSLILKLNKILRIKREGDLIGEMLGLSMINQCIIHSLAGSESPLQIWEFILHRMKGTKQEKFRGFPFFMEYGNGDKIIHGQYKDWFILSAFPEHRAIAPFCASIVKTDINNDVEAVREARIWSMGITIKGPSISVSAGLSELVLLMNDVIDFIITFAIDESESQKRAIYDILVRCDEENIIIDLRTQKLLFDLLGMSIIEINKQSVLSVIEIFFKDGPQNLIYAQLKLDGLYLKPEILLAIFTNWIGQPLGMHHEAFVNSLYGEFKPTRIIRKGRVKLCILLASMFISINFTGIVHATSGTGTLSGHDYGIDKTLGPLFNRMNAAALSRNWPEHIRPQNRSLYEGPFHRLSGVVTNNYKQAAVQKGIPFFPFCSVGTVVRSEIVYFTRNIADPESWKLDDGSHWVWEFGLIHSDSPSSTVPGNAIIIPKPEGGNNKGRFLMASSNQLGIVEFPIKICGEWGKVSVGTPTAKSLPIGPGKYSAVLVNILVGSVVLNPKIIINLVTESLGVFKLLEQSNMYIDAFVDVLKAFNSLIPSEKTVKNFKDLLGEDLSRQLFTAYNTDFTFFMFLDKIRIALNKDSKNMLQQLEIEIDQYVSVVEAAEAAAESAAKGKKPAKPAPTASSSASSSAF